MSVLSEILAVRRAEVDRAERDLPEPELRARLASAPEPRDFVGALRAATPPALIAEVKRASPSKGVLRHDFDPVALARAYDLHGATCVSVLTEPTHFQGSLEHLSAVRQAISLPVMRKDFVVGEYQLLESRVAGADAVLLIVAALRRNELRRLLGVSHELGMAAFVEVHDEAELDEAIASGAQLIGINNRDLHVFRTDLATTMRLIPRVPGDRIVISESGIRNRDDMVRLGRAGVRGALVGEALMVSADVGAKVRELMGTRESSTPLAHP
jgi:indole-3-glycerol phosphate synthase